MRVPSGTALPLVSFIIPAYKCASYLPQAIESALAQTHANVEVIVVNDGSPDDTDEAVKPYLDRVTYVKQENRGLSAARNVGFRKSHGEFICFLDADDLLLAEKTRCQLEVFRRAPDLGIVISGYIDVGEDGRTEISHVRKPWTRDGLERLLRHEVFPCHTALIRRSVLDASALFPEDIDTGESQEDWQLWLEMALAGVQFGSYAEPTCLYRRRAGSIRSNALRHNDGARRVVRWIRGTHAVAIPRRMVARLAAIIELERAALAWMSDIPTTAAEALAASLREDPKMWEDPATLQLLYLQSLTVHESAQWQERPDPEAMRKSLVSRFLPAVRATLPVGTFQRLRALAWLACADVSYSQHQWAASRRYGLQALRDSIGVCLKPSAARCLLRSGLGPGGALVGRAERLARGIAVP